MSAWAETIGGPGPALYPIGERVSEQATRSTLLEGLAGFVVDKPLWRYEAGSTLFVGLERWRNHVDEVSKVDEDIGLCLRLATVRLVEPLGVIPNGGLATGLADEEDHYEMMWDGDGKSLTVFLYADGRFDWLLWKVAGRAVGEEDRKISTVGELVYLIQDEVLAQQ